MLFWNEKRCPVGLWCSVYPTTLMFTKALSSHIYLPAYYSIVLGLSDMLSLFLFAQICKKRFSLSVGFAIGAICKRVRNFSKLPTLTIGKLEGQTKIQIQKIQKCIRIGTMKLVQAASVSRSQWFSCSYQLPRGQQRHPPTKQRCW